MSHRIIEKRRRDRMNSCLADLSRLIPAEYLKRGRGRIEKTEIIEMAIRHMRHLQESQTLLSGRPTPPPSSSSSYSSSSSSSSSPGSSTSYSNAAISASCHQVASSIDGCETADEGFERFGHMTGDRSSEQYRSGFLECLTETLRFLVEVEGFPADASLCISLDSHLRAHCTALLKGEKSQKPDRSHDEHNQYCELATQRNGQYAPEPTVAMEEDLLQHGEHRDYVELERAEEKPVIKQKDNNCHLNGLNQSSAAICQETGASYKFKNSIKWRFTAGLEKRQKIEEESEEKKPPKDPSVVLMHSVQSPIQTTFLQTDSRNVKVSQQQHHPSSRVPVFALHSEHSFYVPLMLDLDSLAPHASQLSKQAPALHPVTISVNFCNGGEEECEEENGRGGNAPMAPSPNVHPLQSENYHRNWKSS
ncbi:hypothetical protein J437_LFUL001166 [Ladona fulva]|uniref:Uncharacterized protein n=1 Tax=Ladona fulva TaxID=123851 RepID=A0A8K0JV87_LADFU|nr:hypothetical protein J437_LFUL001166 [Ladona fulva]